MCTDSERKCFLDVGRMRVSEGEASLSPDPVSEGEASLSPDPVSEGEASLSPDPVSEGEASLSPDPVSEGEASLSPDPVSEGEASLSPDPVSEGEASLSPDPVSEGEASLSPDPVSEGEASLSPDPVSEGEASLSPDPVSEGEASLSPDPVSEGEASLSPDPVSEGEASLSPDPVSEGEAPQFLCLGLIFRGRCGHAHLYLLKTTPPQCLAKENTQMCTQFAKVANELKSKDKYNTVLFSCLIRKVNRFNKSKDRALLLTDRHMYKLEPRKNFKLLKSLPLECVNGVSVTCSRDQLVVFHTVQKDDMLTCLQRVRGCENEDRVGELLGVLADHFKRLKTPLQVTVQRSAIQFHMRGQQKCVSVETKIGHNQPDFRKSRGGFTLYLPGN
ncbi:Unconventional myosin-Id [Acipenser ruthenus]|uniref:Unconventional myosin-Id n=1 Tax=Acipenser ruthenus TaxID=7906 RepID=A0A662Z067_ACIRT|nr:Unconventional myosin-Id [Acipenser ruthenus]